MTKIIELLVLTAILSWSFSDQQEDSTAQIVKDKLECDKSVAFGDTHICLPEIERMTECYSVPIVKRIADQFEYEGNSVLAFYLNNDTYNQVDRLDEITYDDYFKIYVTNQLKGVKVGKEELNELSATVGGNFIKENWDEIKDKIEKNHDYLSVGRPVLIESYSPHSNAKSFILLVKYQAQDYEYMLAMSMNMLLIKERLIWLAYYKEYDGEESIKKTKAKNDNIVLQLIDQNK